LKEQMRYNWIHSQMDPDICYVLCKATMKEVLAWVFS
jgi:hypothetical protein